MPRRMRRDATSRSSERTRRGLYTAGGGAFGSCGSPARSLLAAAREYLLSPDDLPRNQSASARRLASCSCRSSRARASTIMLLRALLMVMPRMDVMRSETVRARSRSRFSIGVGRSTARAAYLYLTNGFVVTWQLNSTKRSTVARARFAGSSNSADSGGNCGSTFGSAGGAGAPEMLRFIADSTSSSAIGGGSDASTVSTSGRVWQRSTTCASMAFSTWWRSAARS
mmetsp:Transcript_6404/g.20146  ORF Transcript_6404/g.20146 Transcript_6404/m.20146 type:complete len:226 (-) Transcript_6404:19-696(-)